MVVFGITLLSSPESALRYDPNKPPRSWEAHLVVICEGDEGGGVDPHAKAGLSSEWSFLMGPRPETKSSKLKKQKAGINNNVFRQKRECTEVTR